MAERLSQTTNLLSPTERINIDVLPNFKINDHMNLYERRLVFPRNARDQPGRSTL